MANAIASPAIKQTSDMAHHRWAR